MQLKILGVGNAAAVVKVKTLDDANLLNVSALARVGCTPQHLLSRVATHGLEAAILYYAMQQKLKDAI
jgi:hypothetical protein